MEMVVIIRPSFKKMCGDDACRAALFNHLLYWIAQKAKGHAQSKVKSGAVFWYGTAEEICAGMDDSWSVNKVRKEIKLLVDSGLMGQRRNPAHGWDQTRHYFVGPDQGKAIKEACKKYDVCLLHLGLRPDVFHLLNLVNAIDKSVKCKCQKEEMDLPNMADPSTKNGDAIPKVTAKASSKDNDKGEDASISLDQNLEEPNRPRKPGALTYIKSEMKSWNDPALRSIGELAANAERVNAIYVQSNRDWADFCALMTQKYRSALTLEAFHATLERACGQEDRQPHGAPLRMVGGQYGT